MRSGKYAHYSHDFVAGKIEQLKVQLMESIGILIDYLFCTCSHILQLVPNGITPPSLNSLRLP